MSKLVYLIIIIPLFAVGQPAKFPTKADLTKIYSQAIGDFIKAVNKNNKVTFDTLFIGKSAAGQPDGFPDIDLPSTIENTPIRLVTPEADAKNQIEHRSRTYINLPGWVSDASAEFIFVAFSNGFEHQYDFYINYKYNIKQKIFELEKLEFKGPPFDK